MDNTHPFFLFLFNENEHCMLIKCIFRTVVGLPSWLQLHLKPVSMDAPLVTKNVFEKVVTEVGVVRLMT